jgi:hypothetical protein
MRDGVVQALEQKVPHFRRVGRTPGARSWPHAQGRVSRPSMDDNRVSVADSPLPSVHHSSITYGHTRKTNTSFVCVCVCVCVCVRARACVRACVYACAYNQRHATTLFALCSLALQPRTNSLALTSLSYSVRFVILVLCAHGISCNITHHSRYKVT